MPALTVHHGSIFESPADVIVNPANSFLRHGGGLARVISERALGPMFEADPAAAEADQKAQGWLADQQAAEPIATGNVHITSAGHLPFEAVIHAVGPIWEGGLFFEDALLNLAYSNAMIAAWERGYESVAFPAISAGIFRFPMIDVARIAVAAIRECFLDLFPDCPSAEIWLPEVEDYVLFERQAAATEPVA